MPKLSIVVPVYNVEKYLNQCIDSILGQSFRDFELIIVDDGSKDRSGSICDEYAKADSRVIVIHTENHGVVTARRTGVNCARGEYTAFVDSDDWLDLDFYRSIFETTGEANADVLVCNRVSRAAGSVETTMFQPGYYDRKQLESTVLPQMIYDMSEERYFISPSLWDKVFRTELLKAVYAGVDPAVTLGEDAVCTYPCIARANDLYIINNSAYYHYREDHVSMVNHCDIRLLQRVLAFAVNMNQQFSGFSPVFDNQIQCYIACVGLYSARQVLLLNRELRLFKRVQAVKEFSFHPAIAFSFQQTKNAACSTRQKWKLHFVTKSQLCFWMFLKADLMVQKLKSCFNRGTYAQN